MHIIEQQAGKGILYADSVASKLLARHGAEMPRPLRVFVPDLAASTGARWPTLYCLVPWLSAGRQAFQWEPFRESLFDRLVRLISSGAMAPAVVVAPDLYTEYGGSQYIDSPYFGPHARHIVEEVVPHVERHYPVRPGGQARGVFGRSSGGYGALRLAMDFPGAFAAVACHAGDMGFEWVYRRSLIDLPVALARYEGDPHAFKRAVLAAPKASGFETHVLMMIAMAGFYSPHQEPGAGYEMPIQMRTGALDERVWARWLAHDPVQMLERPDVQEALGRLKLLFLDCGNRDQYFLQYGARQCVAKLKALGISHDYQEFDDNHSGTSYRFDVSLPRLVAGLG